MLNKKDFDKLHTPHLIQELWVDSDKIPTSVPLDEDLDSNGIYYVEINGKQFGIIQKVTKQISSLYDNNKIKDDIFKGILTPWYNEALYPIIIKDTEKYNVNLGLYKFEFDEINGIVSFEGLKDSDLPLEFTFYKYIGRSSSDSFLDTSGLTPMHPDFVPTTDQDVATKGYVDSLTKDTRDITDKLIPNEPPRLKNADLKIIAGKEYLAFKEDKKYFALTPQNDVTISFPTFYLPNTDTFDIQVVIDGHAVDLGDRLKYEIVDYSKVEPGIPDDWYKVVANGVFTLKYSDIPNTTITNHHKINLNLNPHTSDIYSENSNIIVVFGEAIDDKLVGFDKPVFTVFRDGLDVEFKKSGVSFLEVGTEIGINFKTNTFKNLVDTKFAELEINLGVADSLAINQSLIKFDILSLDKTTGILDCSYKFKINHPNSKFEIRIYCYNMFNELVHTYVEKLYILTEQSTNLKRLTCGEGEFPIEFGQNFDEYASINETNDLQEIFGKYCFPDRDYSFFNNLRGCEFLSKGFDYKFANWTKPRYLLKKFSIDELINNFNLIIKKPFGLETIDKIPENFTVQVKHKDTGWLNLTPLVYYKDPVKNNDGTLVTGLTELNQDFYKFNISFGQTPRNGEIYIRIGLKDSKSSFQDFSIEVNN